MTVETRTDQSQKKFTIELMMVFVLLVSLGFPGNLTYIYGDRFGMALEYAAFFVQILAMLFSSGDTWLDVRLVNLEKKYIVLYLFAIIIFIESMLVTTSVSLQVITCIRLCVTILFAIWLQEQFEFERLIELICIAQTLFVLASLAFMALYPGAAFESGATYANALKGLYPTKNTFASELSVGMIVMSFLAWNKRRKLENYLFWVIGVIVQGAMLLMCQATGALFCLIIVYVVFFIPKDIRLPLGWGYIAVNIFFLFAMLTMMPYFEWFFEAIGKDATLTGRIPLWNQIITVMMGHNTLTGYGYGMFWRDVDAVALIHSGFDENSFWGNMTTGAHNVILEYWLNSGLIGIGMLFVVVLYAMRDIEKISLEKYVFSSLILVYLMINGLTERCLGGNYDYKVLFFYLIMAICCNRSVSHPPQKKEEKIRQLHLQDRLDGRNL